MVRSVRVHIPIIQTIFKVQKIPWPGILGSFFVLRDRLKIRLLRFYRRELLVLSVVFAFFTTVKNAEFIEEEIYTVDDSIVQAILPFAP